MTTLTAHNVPGAPGIAAPESRQVAWLTSADVVRILLGLLLLAAAALKGHQLLTAPVTGRSVLESRGFLVALVEVEFLLGVWLLSGLFRRAAWWAALACFSAFAPVALFKALSGERDCGCFGAVEVNPWLTAALDAAAVAALLAFRPRPTPDRRPGGQALHAAAAAALAAAVAVPSSIAMARSAPAAVSAGGDLLGNSRYVVLEPETWVGGPFPLLKHIDCKDNLSTGNWLVVLYRHDCSHCVESIPGYEEKAMGRAGSGAPGIVLVAVPPYAAPGEDPVRADTACRRGRLRPSRSWFVDTPAEIELAAGKVTAARLPRTGEGGEP
jgi:hypothetical protein